MKCNAATSYNKKYQIRLGVFPKSVRQSEEKLRVKCGIVD